MKYSSFSDYVSPGAFPGFVQEKDAKAFCDLLNEIGDCDGSHFVEQCETDGFNYWIVD